MYITGNTRTHVQIIIRQKKERERENKRRKKPYRCYFKRNYLVKTEFLIV